MRYTCCMVRDRQAEERALKAEEHADSLLEELTEAKERVLQLERAQKTDDTSMAQSSTPGSDNTTTSPSSARGQCKGALGCNRGIS